MVLLDTHAFVWLVSDQKKLSIKARRLLALPQQSAGISVISAWEIALLCKRGRLELPLPAEAFISGAVEHHRLIELPLTRQLVCQAVALPDIHNDPFDRILIATAQAHQIPLISKDHLIAQYPDVKAIW